MILSYKYVFLLFLMMQLVSQGYTQTQANSFKTGLSKEDSLSIEVKNIYYANGNLMVNELYLLGQLHGLITYYYDDGHRQAIEFWQEDLLQDSAFYFYPNGELEKKGKYLNGQYEGLWIYYYEHTGLIKRKGSYTEGFPNGLWEFWDENGEVLQKGNYLLGKEHGFWQFYENGQIVFEGNYDKGKRVGKWFKFSKRGKKKTYK